MKMPMRPPTPPASLWATVGPSWLLEHGIVGPLDGDRYRHWDTLRHCAPPDGLSVEEWWLATRLARRPLMRDLPLCDPHGQPLSFGLPDPALEMLMRIDQQASGRIQAPDAVTNPATRDRYLVNSLMEEAIRSSQLEGAATTRQVAKEMLRSGRDPRDRSERMILNNYRAMQFVRDHVAEPLTPALVLRLHRIVTDGTLEDPAEAGRLQVPGEERIKVWWDGEVMYEPPPAEQLPGRLEALCEFANGGGGVKGFLHPVARAILVHFWLAYDHPFVDGNGRTARALFYWAMLSQGYWLAEFLPISNIIREAPARYAKSFLYVETDEGDTTYFVLSQLRILCRAIDELHVYLERKTREVREVEALVRQAPGFNHRQIALLSHALRDAGAHYTFASHQHSHGVVYQSARTDLLDLEERGLLKRTTRGRTYVFFPVPDLDRRLKALSASES